MPQSARNTKQYHHGDLRNALIVAAAELIEERGSDDFAMIDAARRAGVSSAAPYRHFKDKDDLLAGVCELALWVFNQQTLDILAQQEHGTRACIIALGHGYMDFVTEHAAFFDLLWGDRHLHAEQSQAELQADTGFGLFYSAVEAWMLTIGGSSNDALDLAMKMWCVVHGMSALAMNGQLQHFSPGIEIDTLLDTATETFLNGVEMQFSA